MLDKSLPYHNIIMRADWTTVRATRPGLLPDGYSLRTFHPGDAYHWAKIEASAGEFDTAESALAYFTATYLPFEASLSQRCWFVLGQDGLPCATATAWQDVHGGRTWPSLHWVATAPHAQRMGLGKAVTCRTLQTFSETMPGQPVYLHTQTWSVAAIGMYLRLGFYPLKTETFAHHRNDYADAVRALSGHMHTGLYDSFVRTAR